MDTADAQSSFLPLTDSRLRWLKLAVFALAISGVYSIILVLMRTPILTTLIGYDTELKQQLFRMALIVHVDLSVLVWMLAIACMLWQQCLERCNSLFADGSYYLFCVGVLIISVSPLFGGTPNLNNYVPILDNLLFIIGIACVLCATMIMAFSVPLFSNQLAMTYVGSAIIFAATILSFILSVPEADIMLHGSILDRHDYYEMLFWGPGHILQFLYVHLAMVAWRSLVKVKKYDNCYDFLLLLNAVFAVSAIICHFLADGDESFILIKDFFTQHMKYFGGIAPTLAAIVIVAKCYGNFMQGRELGFAAVICSFILFFSGGLIALAISGYNVTIPAHYHGSVVGVSVALMGFVYSMLMPHGGQDKKNAVIQLYLYSFGQMLHIIGLAISGGYGALRKTPGEDFPAHIKASMGLMGLGGLIAIIGGLMFVVICFRCFSTPIAFNAKKS